ncbi:DUF3488 and transglutaminase-like domain-containing protein [Streptomyces sp. MI02-7b]|uniref:transglutaminase TgpA family protein n=1 Tax=Streptomyces sp. MI02-7b TaxID=462941 RepID=UPI0029A328A6|nr:DUF3488 and transglutaminase-like domain-containing protein [Streptomyces sp. MI02-7b]MDX3075190.1 DUF3488 and transglutaminase-like domain-containing protein [Streptomyces sp. MI02-7b]
MSGRARIAAFAALATILTSFALTPLATPSSWILQAMVLVLLQTGVGAAARRVPLARPLTIGAQAIVSLLALTLLFVHDQAVLGVFPGPPAFTEFGRLLTAGVQDVGQFAIPAPVTEGIRLLLVGGVVLIGLVVDALAVTYGSAAPAGLPLLALYSVAAGLSGGASKWWLFLLAGVGYLLLLLAEGRDRLSRWGRIFGGAGGAPRGGNGPAALSAGGPVAPVRTGHRIGAVALGVALLAGLAPGLGGGLLGATGAGQGGGGGGGTIAAVNPVVALQDNLNQPDDREVLRYRTNAQTTADMYLRIVSLDQFTGDKWEPSQRALTDVPKVLPVPQGLGPQIATSLTETSVVADRGYVQMWLPMPYPAQKVRIDGRWRYEPEGRTIIGDRGQNTSGASYEVTSLRLQPTAQQLAAAPPAPAKLRAEYTKVPDSLPDEVNRTALEITKNATNDYERAVALQRWFTSGAFTYDTSVRSGTGVQAITRFLKNKEGFCIHFAFTMAAMSRTLGIPARVAVGFTPGTPESDGTYSVGLKDAHAWPELYFEGVGWTRFEPTPTRGTTPDYTVETSASDPAGAATDTPQQSATTAPSAGPTASPTCRAKDIQLGDCDPLAGSADSTSPDGGFWQDVRDMLASVWFGAGIVLALLVLLFFAPLLWRHRLRVRRLTRGSDPAAVAAWLRLTGRDPSDPGVHEGARTLAAWQELTDTAWDYGLPPDDSETPRAVVARLAGVGGLQGPAEEAARRLAGAVEQALFSPRPVAAVGSAADVRLVTDGLRHSADRLTRLRALLLPRSAVRVVWRLSEAWADRRVRAAERFRDAGDALRRPLRRDAP